MEVRIKQETFSGKKCYTAEIFGSTNCVGQGDTVQEAYDEAMGNYEAKKNFEATNKPQHKFKVGDRLKPAKSEPRWSFTEDEKTILRNLPEGYKWIARDEDDILCCFKSRYKPTKDEFFGIWNCANAMELRPFSHIFSCVKWSDDEPCEFRKFL